MRRNSGILFFGKLRQYDGCQHQGTPEVFLTVEAVSQNDSAGNRGKYGFQTQQQGDHRGVRAFLGEDLDTAISNLNQTAAPLRRQLKQNENRMRAIAQIKDAAAAHAKLKPIHDTFIKKNFKLTKDAYAAQHKEELDTFNKAVRTLMKLNGSTAVDFSALDAEFSALQSGSAELRTKLETLQPDVSALKNIRKYIDMVLNKQQLSTPGGKPPEKESVLKQLEQLQQKKSNYKTISTTPNREESL